MLRPRFQTCAEKDRIPSQIDRRVVKECVSTVIASYWGKVMAKAWMDNDCTNTQPVECETCCVDEWGDAIEGCDCDVWTANCHEAVSARTGAVAKAWVAAEVKENTATCTTTVYEKVRGITQQVSVDSGPAVRSQSAAV